MMLRLISVLAITMLCGCATSSPTSFPTFGAAGCETSFNFDVTLQKCYRIEDPATLNEANSICTIRGRGYGSLLMVNDISSLSFVQTNFDTDDASIWLPIRYNSENSLWEQENGDPVTIFNWQESFPEGDLSVKSCAYARVADGLWENDACNSPANSNRWSACIVPAFFPSAAPTFTPSLIPTQRPTVNPTDVPTAVPTESPSALPTKEPTAIPSGPTVVPSAKPTPTPTAAPTVHPTFVPTAVPSSVPTLSPTAVPSAKPTATPTKTPSAQPSFKPSAVPSASPTPGPTFVPSAVPSLIPTAVPSAVPSSSPSIKPTAEPSMSPTVKPSAAPSLLPTVNPTSGICYPGYGYDFDFERCLMFTSTRFSTWNNQQGFCNAANQGNGNLVTIKSAEENELVSAIWIGLKYDTTVSAWKWVSGEPLVYTNWAPGHPTNPTVNSCAYLRGAQDWVSVPCTDVHYTYCELPQAASSTFYPSLKPSPMPTRKPTPSPTTARRLLRANA